MAPAPEAALIMSLEGVAAAIAGAVFLSERLGALALLGDVELSGWVQERLDSQVRHLLIDEFQDTSPLQWQALHGWLQAYAGAGGGAPTSCKPRRTP